MIVYEGIQARNAGLGVYVSNFWNIVDIASILVNIIVLVGQIAQMDIQTLNNLAALGVFLIWLKLFYWMRLFDPTAAFLRMITEILIDSVEFIIMLIICVLMFSSSLAVLNNNRTDEDDEPLFDDRFSYPVDGFI